VRSAPPCERMRALIRVSDGRRLTSARDKGDTRVMSAVACERSYVFFMRVSEERCLCSCVKFTYVRNAVRTFSSVAFHCARTRASKY
jgi:hypothetical protein